jgi:hypothetical protein
MWRKVSYLERLMVGEEGMAFGLRFKAVVLSLLFSVRAGATDVDRPIIYSVYGTDIIVRLARMHAHPERDGPNGTLVVALYGRTPGYVACRFSNNGATLLCEACVGRYPPKPGKAAPTISNAIEDGLKKAGYYRDADGRAVFRYNITLDSDVLGGAALAMLKPLIDVFGARASSKITIVAPLAPEYDEAAIERELRR